MTIDRFIPLGTGDGGGHQTYTVGATSVTIHIPKHARGILMQALTQNMRYTLDGTTPTASKGYRLTAGNDPLYVELEHRISLKVIAETAGAVLEYEFGDVNNGSPL